MDFYWIGGSNNWNNSNVWSLESSGSSTWQSPDHDDNVIFDDLLEDGDVIKISNTHYMLNFDCSSLTKNITFKFYDNSFLYVGGDIILSNTVSFSYPPLTYSNLLNKIFNYGIIIWNKDVCHITSNNVKLPPIKHYFEYIISGGIGLG